MASENDPVSVIVRGGSWGIGRYRVPEEFRSEFGEFGYGIGYQPENPHDFWPDEESCSPKELAAHAEACRVWDMVHVPEPPDGD